MNESVSQPLKFFIFGYFGWNNMGDDSIGLAVLKELSSRYINSDFTITANADYFLSKNDLQHIKQIKFDILSILWSIIKSDIFIIVGGTHFQDEDEYYIRRLKLNLFFYLVSFFARIFNKSPILFEHGVGHLKSKSSLILIKQILRNSKGIVLRDSKSFNIIKSLNTGIKSFKGFDVTSSLIKYIDYNNRSNNVLGISVLPVYSIYSKTPEKDDLIVKGFSISIKRILKENKNIKIKLFEFRSGKIHSDGPILTEISNNLCEYSDRVKLISYNGNIINFLKELNECTRFLGMRYHSVLFSYLLNMPLISVEYMEKNEFLNYDINLPIDSVVKLDNFNSSMLYEKINKLLINPQDFTAKLPLNNALKYNEEGFNFLDNLIHPKKSMHINNTYRNNKGTMKILQVIPYMALKRGGDVNVCHNISKKLIYRHELKIITTDIDFDELYINKIRDDGIKVTVFKNYFNIAFFLISPYIKNWSKKNLKNFSIIHMHGLRTYQNLIIRHYAMAFGVPYIVEAHGSLPYLNKLVLKKIFDNLWGYKILRDATMVIALTQTEFDQYKKMGVNENKIKIIPNGIELTEYENLPRKNGFRNKYNIKSNEKIILYLGRIHKTKGVDLLVEVFKEISEEFSDVKLVIAGSDDGFLSNLKMNVAKLKISDKVIFTGPLYGEDKLKAYMDADIFITPSYSGFPITFLEACACGTPIITTTKGDKLNWINEVGYIVDYDNNELKQAIMKMLTNEELRIKFGENGKKIVQQEFNWDKISKRIEDIYRKTLESIE